MISARFFLLSGFILLFARHAISATTPETTQALPVLSEAEYALMTAQQQSVYVSDFKLAWLQFANNFSAANSAPQRVRSQAHYNRTTWTPNQYGETARAAQSAFENSCGTFSSQQTACNALLKDIVTATPEGACPILGAKGDHRIQVPPFGFTAEYRCAFQANSTLLRKVAENGCKDVDVKTAPSNDLFTTTFEASAGVSLLGPSNVFDGIIEDVQEQDGRYIVQMLKPNLLTKPVSLERISFVVRKVQNIYMLRLPTGTEVEVKIKNNSRKNIMPRFVSVQGRAAQSKEQNALLDHYYDATVLMASNCKLSEGLKKLGAYQPARSAPSTPKPSEPSKSAK